MHHGKSTSKEHLKLRFSIRIIVAGSRSYTNYPEFCTLMDEYATVHHLDEKREQVVFVTGKAPRGADEMIIRWCYERGYTWVEYEANWNDLDAPGAILRTKNEKTYNVRAGHDRNQEMAMVSTHLVLFWDGMSKGSADMLNRATHTNLVITKYLVDPDVKEIDHGRKSQGRRATDSLQH